MLLLTEIDSWYRRISGLVVGIHYREPDRPKEGVPSEDAGAAEWNVIAQTPSFLTHESLYTGL